MTDCARIVEIEVTIDLNCPWCFFALRHLRTALSRLEEDIKVVVHFHHFILFDGLPTVGATLTPCMMTSAVKEAAISASVSLNDNRVLAPSIDAHIVLCAAEKAGVAIEFLEALFVLYFEQGKSISNHDILASAATSAGMTLTQYDVSEMTKTDGLSPNRRCVFDSVQSRKAAGISKVPHFVVGEQGKRCKFSFYGANNPDVFDDAISELENQR